jgi:hypothetical protein
MLHVHYMNKVLPRGTIMLQTIRIYVMWIVSQLHRRTDMRRCGLSAEWPSPREVVPIPVKLSLLTTG